jgi:UDPglucose 6-dehydrogenase
MKVSMIGCGKLGAPCANEMVNAGHTVTGYDPMRPPTPKFPLANSIQEAVLDAELIFVAVPTPHEEFYGGETPTSHLEPRDFDYFTVTDVLRELNNHCTQDQLVVLISTVLPGTVRSQFIQHTTNYRFIYNPYLIAMGTVERDMVNPEMVIIGTQDGSLTGDAKILIDFYKTMMQNDPRYEVGTWDEAESIKIFYNTFISTKIALVNMIQDVAERNGNINVDVVTNALKKSTDRIMGPKYMTAGMGDGGACHPRDNIALRYLAKKLNLGYDLFDSIMVAREIQAKNIAERCIENGKKITIIGKSYKPGVPYLNGSSSLLVGHYIEQLGGEVNYYDEHTGDSDLRTDWTDVYLIGYWEEYVENIRFPSWVTVIDPWRKLTSFQHPGEIIHYGNTRNQNPVNIMDEETRLIFQEHEFKYL